jgi:hypothetical protein
VFCRQKVQYSNLYLQNRSAVLNSLHTLGSTLLHIQTHMYTHTDKVACALTTDDNRIARTLVPSPHGGLMAAVDSLGRVLLLDTAQVCARSKCVSC